jgi:hypothetical protein
MPDNPSIVKDKLKGIKPVPTAIEEVVGFLRLLSFSIWFSVKIRLDNTGW